MPDLSTRRALKKKEDKEKKLKKSAMFAGAFVLVMAAVLLLASVLAETSRHDGSWINFEANISPKATDVIVTTLNDFKTAFGCPAGNIVVGTNLVNDRFEAEGEVTDAQADSGRIDFNPNLISDVERLQRVTIHEATHACKMPAMMFSEPLIFSQGEILGISGLSLIVRLSDGTETRFTKCEEAVAERNAAVLDHSYEVQHPGYLSLGKLALDIFPVGTNPQNLVWTNDFFGFSGAVLNRPGSEITVADIETVMGICMDRADDTSDEAMAR